nr:MFS transporter [Paenibacillus sp. SYP-B3998]
MLPFEKEFGWNRGSISGVISMGILLYGLTGPFAAALLAKFGIRRGMLVSLAVLAVGLLLTPQMKSLWQFELLWGLVAGLGTGMMANVLGVAVSNQWFVKRRGLVVGLLTASAATGQLLFLPLLAKITVEAGWRTSIYTAVAVIVVVFVLVAIWIRNNPYEVGASPYGTVELVKPETFKGSVFLTPIRTLRAALKNKTFWLLAGTFFSVVFRQMV